MTHTNISADLRTEKGRSVNAIRASGKVPGVLYGFGTEPMNLVVDRNALNKVYSAAGESTVVDLELQGVKHPVLIADIQRDVLTDFISHIDFRRVDATRRIDAHISLKFVGEAPAVKALGGTFMRALEELDVTCLPDALVHEIEVHIDKLMTFDDAIHVSDIAIPEGITVNNPLEQAVASVKPPRSDAEMAALNSAVEIDVSKIEVITEVPKEEGDGADGAKKEAKK